MMPQRHLAPSTLRSRFWWRGGDLSFDGKSTRETGKPGSRGGAATGSPQEGNRKTGWRERGSSKTEGARYVRSVGTQGRKQTCTKLSPTQLLSKPPRTARCHTPRLLRTNWPSPCRSSRRMTTLPTDGPDAAVIRKWACFWNTQDKSHLTAVLVVIAISV